LADATRPSLDAQQVNGDTILPVSTDTITNGTVNVGFPIDLNPMTYNLAEGLDSLVITFAGADGKSAVLRIDGAADAFSGQVLSKGTSKIIDFSNIALGKGDSVLIANTDGTSPVKETAKARGDTPLTTQIYTIKFSATDLAGNKNAADLTRNNVYVDVDNLAFARLFPSGGGLDTLERVTSRVIFRLSEPADSVIVTYTKLAGPDPAASRSRLLTGSQLTNTTSEQEIQVDSLVSGTDYILTVLGRDLAGNYTKTAPDTFRYDTLSWCRSSPSSRFRSIPATRVSAARTWRAIRSTLRFRPRRLMVVTR
jgi:hypothetical protein